MVEPDYVTVAPTMQAGRFCVLLMKYHHQGDEFLAVKSSQALPEMAARALALSWAAALHVEVR